ncbi:ABC transporter [Alicycliphilus sp. B1]|nr:ABC transporter [Alicycliphilus sp. B1]
MRAVTRALRDSSPSGWNLLNSGAMKIGKTTISSRLKPIHAPQAQSHHSRPAAPMSQSMSAAIGRPITAPSSVDLSRSASHRRGVIWLKPKRCSRRKVWYSWAGRSMAPLTSAKAASSASCCTMPPPSQASRAWFSASSPPSSVQPSTAAVARAISSRPKRALAMV